MEEISAVTHVPMFWPMMIGRAALYFTAPVMQSACKIPTEADEDWMIAVSTAPAITPRIGLVNINRMFVNSGTSASGLTAPAHHLHAGHQHGKADHDAARVVLLVALGKEQQTDADKRQNGRECRRFAQRQQQAVALQARQRKNPAGDRRADVRAHDDARRLREPHDARS